MGHEKQLFFIYIFNSDFRLDIHISFLGLVHIVEKFLKIERIGICGCIWIHIYGAKDRI
jgi:hypothetical protein